MQKWIFRTGLLAALAIGGCSGESSDDTNTGVTAPVGGTQVAAPGSPGSTGGTDGSGALAGSAGSAAPAPAGAGSDPAAQPAAGDDPATAGDPAQMPGTTQDPTQTDPMTGEPPALALDECGLDTGFPGDEFCILPPPPDQGFQVHIGPSSYDNPEPEYVLEPGQETNMYFDAVSGNDEPVYFYYRQYRMRSGSHHMIISESSGGLGGGLGEFGGGRRLGGSQNHAKDNPDMGIVAPENEGVGVPLDAKVPLTVNLHYINTTDAPVLQETWINFWYKDEAEVTDEAHEMFLLGSVSFAVQPGENTILGPYGCDVSGSGRILSMYGHRHANADRFSAWRIRGGQRELIYESLNWQEPLVLEYNSLVQNAAPMRDMGIEGGHSGILDLQPGDRLEWECHVVNQSDGVLRFTNETFDGEMCILIGDTVGTTVNCAPGVGGFGF